MPASHACVKAQQATFILGFATFYGSIMTSELEEGLGAAGGPWRKILKCTRTPIPAALHLLEEMLGRGPSEGGFRGPCGAPADAPAVIDVSRGITGESGVPRTVFAWETAPISRSCCHPAFGNSAASHHD